MKIGSIVSEVQRDVVEMQRTLQGLGSKNKAVSNTYPLWRPRMNKNHHQNSEHIWSRIPRHSSSGT